MKILRNILLGVLVLVIILVAVGAFTVNRWTTGPLPQHEGTIALDGLDGEVSIIRDEWGVPHIYASTLHDLRFAQGYVQAQDRWWQMEFARHTGHGRIQELTGQSNKVMSSDIFIRSAGWSQASQRDIDALAPDVLVELQDFADGVNAYILNRPASELAFEYNVLGLTGVNIPIEPWTPVDTAVWTKVMAWDLSGNRGEELLRSAIAGELGNEMADAYMPEFPYDERPTIIWPEEIPETGAFASQAMNDTAGMIGVETQFAGNFDIDTGFLFGSGAGIGSNNWVVSGEHTESGMPLLANDPHLGIQMPSIWYEIGLHCMPISEECPDSVQGFALPAAPGIIIGHNENIAWGVTNVGWDTQDLYLITVNPDNELQYLWNGEWRDMTVRDEEIQYGDGGSVTIQVRETHLGPIINDNRFDEETGKVLGFNNEDPLAFRWTAYEVSTIQKSIFMLNRASNWDEFHEALRYWDTPSQNVIYADIQGNIGYQTPGNIPIRIAGHTGKLPVDGSTDEFEWLGYVPYEYLPSVLNPERGYIATANQALVPMGYYSYLANELGGEFGADSHYVFDYGWALGYRGQRVNELIEAQDKHSFDTFEAIQGDNKLIFAEEITPYLSELDMGSVELNDLRDWMLNWDYQMHMDSPQAALFAYFWYHLTFNLYDDQLPFNVSANEARHPSGDSREMWATTLLLNDLNNAWWDDNSTEGVTENRDEIVARSFSQAYDSSVAALGSNRDDWTWGDLHTATFVSNPLGLSGIGLIEDTVNRGPARTSGGAATLNATRWSYDDDTVFSVATLPSMRMIVDLSNINNSLTVHTTGQSSHPFSDHYGDMIDDWRNIHYHPMLWSREDVDANAAATLILQANH
jgi:penicillin amidase